MGKVLAMACMLCLSASLAAQELSFAGLQTTLNVSGLPQPNAITIDALGNRYLVDNTLANIIEVNAAGVQTIINSTLSGPSEIAVDSAGNLYVADTGHRRVLKIAVGGGAQTTVGSGFTNPTGVAVDSVGNVYVADPGATPKKVWKVAAAGGAITAVATASLNSPIALATDGADNLYIADDGDNSVVKVSPGGSVSFLFNGALQSPSSIAVNKTADTILIASAGHGTVKRFAANGNIQQLGTGLSTPSGVAIDGSGHAYVTDFAAAQVDIISPGAIDFGQANLCPASGAQTAPCSQQVVLNFVVGDSQGLTSLNAQAVTQGSENLDFNAIANTCTGTLAAGATCSVTVVFKPLAPGIRIGAVDVVGIVPPFEGFRPGPHPQFGLPAGGVLLSTVYLHGVGVGPQAGFDAALINTLPFTLQPRVAGGVHPNGGGGPQPTSALQGVTAVSNGDVYVIDGLECIVEKFTAATSITSRVAGAGCQASSGDGGPATSAFFRNGYQVAVNGRGDIYIPDLSGSAIRKVDALTGLITTVAGILNSYGYTAGPVLATAATLSAPGAAAVDAEGNFYYSDNAEYSVRKVDVSTGILTTVAGTHVPPGYSGDGGPATSAVLGHPAGIALDGAGNLYIPDVLDEVVRKVAAGTGIITTVAGSGRSACGYGGDLGPATSAMLCGPIAISVDSAGNLYIADANNAVIRKVNASTGDVTTAAGVYSTTPPAAYTGDGGPATRASLVALQGVTLDGAGNFYVSDGHSNVIRKITAAEGIANFGAFSVAESSPPQDVTATNNGNAVLDFSGLPVSTNFNLSGANTTCSASTTLNPGASCVLGIAFLPTAAGSLTGNVTLHDNVANDTTSIQSVALSGTGIAQVASKLALAGLPPTAATGGNLGTATVAIEDVSGNLVTASSATVTLTITGPNGYSQAVMAAAVSGTATFNLTSLLLPLAGTYTVTATSTGLTAVSTTVAVTAAAAGAAKLALAGLPLAIAAGGNLGDATVAIETAGGSVVSSSSATVTLTITGPNSYSQLVSAAAVSGTASFDLSSKALTATGVYTVTATSPSLTAVSTTVAVTAAIPAGSPAQLALGGVPATVAAGGNMGTVTVAIEAASGSIVTGSSAAVTLTITGPSGYFQVVTATAVNGIATFNLTSLELPAAGTYGVTAISGALTAVPATVAVTATRPGQDFTLNFTAGSNASPTQTVLPGAAAIFPFTLAPASGNFVGVITLSATGPLVGATYSFAPPTVTPGSTSTHTTMTVQTRSASALARRGGRLTGYGTLALGLLLLPFAGSRKGRHSLEQSRMPALALLSLGVACGVTGCAAGGLFSQAPQTYTITVTGTSGTLTHSTTVTLIEQ